MKTVYERADIVPLLAEIFRELGYEGATLSLITERTGIGKGSLYHFFPGGKEEMAGAVLADIDAWIDALRSALMRAGCVEEEAQTLAEEGVCGIQGALVLSPALKDETVFIRSLETLAKRLGAATR